MIGTGLRDLRDLVRSLVERGGARAVVVWRSPWPVALLATAFLLVGVPEMLARILSLPGGLVLVLDYGVVTGLVALLAVGWSLAWLGRFAVWPG